MNLNRYIPALLNNLIWILLVVVILMFSVLNPMYLTGINFLNILFHASVLGLLVIGETFVFIPQCMDLSIESTLGLCAAVGAWLCTKSGIPDNGSGWGVNPLLAEVILLAVGALIGVVIGNLITRLKMNFWVVTLAMLIGLRGIQLVFTYANTIYGTPPLYNWLGTLSFGPVPLPVIVVIVAFIIAHIVLAYTPFGRELYAIGGNREAARASGVNPEKRIRQVYLIAALLAALAGWMLSGHITSVDPVLGQGDVFEVMAACVMGGVSLSGGRGTMVGAFGGVLLLSAVASGLNLVNISPFWTDAIRGLIILIAMLIDAQRVRYSAPAAAKTGLAAPAVPAGR